MIKIDEEKTIHLTRGDIASFDFSVKKDDDTDYTFVVGDVIRLSVTAKNDETKVKLTKDIVVTEETTTVSIELDKDDTKFDTYINKPTDFWYEIVLNPDTQPQTIIGYDEDGAKIFKLYPESGDVE